MGIFTDKEATKHKAAGGNRQQTADSPEERRRLWVGAAHEKVNAEKTAITPEELRELQHSQSSHER